MTWAVYSDMKRHHNAPRSGDGAHPATNADNPRMRRADRLFQIVQLVRGRRLSTAEFLASRLEVAMRTVYRDIADLQSRGVPIDGQAGVGYRMRAGFDLPPLMFTPEEAQALVASVRLAQPRLDKALAAQAELALGKVMSVLPAAQRAAAEGLALFAIDNGLDAVTRERLVPLRDAVHARRTLAIDYVDAENRATRRRVRPLGCFHWEAVWTLAAWCELRSDFRNFRIDRIQTLTVLDERVRDEAGKTLADLLRAVGAERNTIGR
jgi:predicted DNA-binding transcriptional regulator YafY